MGAFANEVRLANFHSRRLNLRDIAGTANHRQARIFREARIGVGEFTPVERRSTRRLNPLRVLAVDAQPNAAVFIFLGCFCHIRRIAYLVGIGAQARGAG